MCHILPQVAQTFTTDYAMLIVHPHITAETILWPYGAQKHRGVGFLSQLMEVGDDVLIPLQSKMCSHERKLPVHIRCQETPGHAAQTAQLLGLVDILREVGDSSCQSSTDEQFSMQCHIDHQTMYASRQPTLTS